MLVNLCNTAPLLHPHQLVVIHDAATFTTPASYSFAFRSWYRLLHRRLAGRPGTRLATVSRFSRAELARELRVSAESIGLIPNGVDHLATAADESIVETLGLRGARYVVGMYSSNPNKNVEALLAIAPRLAGSGVRLVLVGDANKTVFGHRLALERADSNVIPAGRVSDAQLRALFSHAACFVFPSTYEGFGIPALEAMHVGCPVVIGDCPGLREACGNAALAVPPHDRDALLGAVARLIEQPDARTEMRSRGHARARECRWARSLAALQRELAKLSAHPPRRALPVDPSLPP
jgi:glycosyltransferase involved in cell wall biosynthesis